MQVTIIASSNYENFEKQGRREGWGMIMKKKKISKQVTWKYLKLTLLIKGNRTLQDAIRYICELWNQQTKDNKFWTSTQTGDQMLRVTNRLLWPIYKGDNKLYSSTN